MIIYRQKTILPKLHERIFVAPQQGIAPQGMNTVNKYTPNFHNIEERLVKSNASVYSGHYNPAIGDDINRMRKKFRKQPWGTVFYGEGKPHEFPVMPISEHIRTGRNVQENAGYVYKQPNVEQVITNVDSIYYPDNNGKRIFRIDALDKDSVKATRYKKYQDLIGTDAGEIYTSSPKIIGEDALVSIPKDTGFERHRRFVNGKWERDSGINRSQKKLRKYLKKNHKLVNGLDRPTLEFMYGKRNPNIEKMMKNAKRIL